MNMFACVCVCVCVCTHARFFFKGNIKLLFNVKKARLKLFFVFILVCFPVFEQFRLIQCF